MTKFNEIILPTNKRFGLFFSAVFLVISIYFFFNKDLSTFLIFLVLAFIFCLISIAIPKILLPLNKLWMFIGFALGKIVSPIILAILYGGIFVPIGIFFKIIGRDELSIKKRKNKSFWKTRVKVDHKEDLFKNQF